MNSGDELTGLIADFELFLKEVSTDILGHSHHREILMRIHEFLLNLQQQTQPEDKVEKLAKIISDSVVSKLESIKPPEELEFLTAEIKQLKSINHKILAKLIELSTIAPGKPNQSQTTQNKQEQSDQINRLTDLFTSSKKEIWYLGLDFGTLGLAAVLFNAHTQKQYPLYWCLKSLDGMTTEQFRFPTLIYQSTVNQSWLLGGLNLPEDTDIIIDHYKPNFNWSILTLEESEILTKLFLQLHNAQTKQLEQASLRGILGQLEGIIINFPSAWSDTYHYNLRESLLQTYLVQEPRQIFYLEEAIATLLGRFREQQLSSGWTLVINGSNCTTEIALVNLSENWQRLSYDDFSLETISYGQRSLEQDIFIQFIYPLYAQEIPQINSELPKSGQIEQLKRYQLDQYLQSYPLAYSFIEAARLISLMLQQQSRVNIPLGSHNCQVEAQDFREKIITPWLSNQEQILQQMLTERNIYPGDLKQVICSGGLSLTVINYLQSWIKIKFPQANIIIDTEQENALRVAQGLAYLPLFPQILNRSRHQYSDYFLLRELLNILSLDLFTLEELMQKLASRGINTRVCKKRVLALLKGEFPPGIVSGMLPGERSLILPEQKGYYRVNITIRDHLHQSLGTILSQSLQHISEPLLVNLPLGHESP